MIQILVTIIYLYCYIKLYHISYKIPYHKLYQIFQRGKNWASSLDVLDTDLDSHSDFCPTVSAGRGLEYGHACSYKQKHIATPTHPTTPHEIKKVNKQNTHTPQSFKVLFRYYLD